MMINIKNALFILNFFRQLNCEMFSAIDKLEKLARDEKLILQELEIFANQVNDDYIVR